MTYLTTSVSRYIFIILFSIYTLNCFVFSRTRQGSILSEWYFHIQNLFVYAFLAIANLILYMNYTDNKILVLLVIELLFFVLTTFSYSRFFENASLPLVNMMCMFLAISFVMLTRLDTNKAVKQIIFSYIAVALCMLIPLILGKTRDLREYGYIYGGVGVALLLLVTLLAQTEYGAKLSISLFGFSMQPAEFVKISFVLFIAALLYKGVNIKNLLIVTAISAIHILILVHSTDLGGAFIFSAAYIIMIFIATRNYLVLILGAAMGSGAFYMAYKLFSHVRIRVTAFLDPLSVVEDQGYQISQSLFAIGSGGWIGTGLGEGSPTKIPVVTKDFIFSAIAEEFGCLFAISLILVFICFCLLMFKLSMKTEDRFYKFVLLGFATVFIVEVLLNIGGSIKFIPSTGVTLPLVSYGGSSLLATILLLSLVNALNGFKEKAPEASEETSKPKRKRSINFEYAIITYLFIAVFLSLEIYFVRWNLLEADSFIDNPFNSRFYIFNDMVVRGDILTSDGTVVATTNTDEYGEEYRYYPYKELFFHTVGYTSNGKAGVESEANYYLLRSNINTSDKISNDLAGIKNPGDNVYMTLDYDMQVATEKSLGKYRGAAVVLDPETGRVLAMVSKPDFDTNNLDYYWENIVDKESGLSLLVNRATQGLYPPGSTFKILTTLSYIRANENYDDYSYNCTGTNTVGDFTIHCAGNKAHGKESLITSFANSCNSSYSYIGLNLDQDQFNATCDSMLFNTDLPTAISNVNQSTFGLVPTDNEECIGQTAIGQGNTTVTPLHMAMIVSAIANDGVLMEPYTLEKVESADGYVVEEFGPTEYGQILSNDEVALLSEYMRKVVTDGTARKIEWGDYEVYGKTGSAEYTTDKKSTHSWFVGYAVDDNGKKLALAVIMEGAGSGSSFAAPAACEIFDAYFN